jgi:hypothetical protein
VPRAYDIFRACEEMQGRTNKNKEIKKYKNTKYKNSNSKIF